MSLKKLYLSTLLLSWCFIISAMDIKKTDTKKTEKKEIIKLSSLLRLDFKNDNKNTKIPKSPDDEAFILKHEFLVKLQGPGAGRDSFERTMRSSGLNPLSKKHRV